MNIITRVLRIICAIQISITFIVSSVITNILQLVVWCSLFLPLRTRLGLVQKLSNGWYDVTNFALTRFGGVRFHFTGDKPEDPDANVIVVGNHSAGLDFMSGVVVSHRFGVNCGRFMTFMKQSLQFVPTIGWTMWCQGSLFLKRSWEKDEKRINAKLDSMKTDYPRPFWIGVYPEGTRITDEKRKQSHKFAREKDLPILNHVLIPRSKGFCHVTERLKGVVSEVYDTTIAYDEHPMYLRDLFLRGEFRCKGAYVHVERHSMDSLPIGDTEKMKEWLLASFIRKDERLEKFLTAHHFDAPPFDPRGHNVAVFFSMWTIVVGLLGTLLVPAFGVGSPYAIPYLGAWFTGFLFTLFYGRERKSRSSRGSSSSANGYPAPHSNGHSKKEM